MESTIRLFKALPITKKGKKTNKSLLTQTVKKGFIFAPEVVANYSEAELQTLVKVVEENLGLSADKMNNAFHKSWGKVATASIEQLVAEQIVHYMTTYGFERLGIYNKDTVYIPTEKLKIPKIDVEKFPLMVVKGYTKVELKYKLIVLLSSGVALKEDTKRDVVDVALFIGLTEYDISLIRNKEVRVALFDYLGMIPDNPIEFLRFMVYKSINKTLLIKDRATIAEIKMKDNLAALRLLEQYREKYGLSRLAEIFYRFKPLFLAFRSNKSLKVIINKVRKLALTNHKPMVEDYLNTITALIKRGEEIDKAKLKSELKRVNTFRKIRLAYALNFRLTDAGSILYRVRNGKSFATGFKFDGQKEAKGILKIVLKSIAKDIAENVAGKKVYLPSNIQYALPATEKQFTGYFPSGSYVSVPKDMIFGVHWTNVGDSKGLYSDGRVDLDLSLISVDGKFGWDRSYRNEEGSILFSGDMTDAPKPNGATELFYVKRQEKMAAILMVNFFNGGDFSENKQDVPFDIIVAKEQAKNFKQNYMVDPNNVVAISKSGIKAQQKVLGLLVSTPEESRFYFAESYLGKGITSRETEYVAATRQYFSDFYKNPISLNEILEEAGVKFVKDPEKADIDLSPEKLEKDTILSLLAA